MSAVPWHRAALAEARPTPFWLDRADAPAAEPALVGEERCDLCIVGGGFTGLWTAIIAKEREPGREVVLLEADTVGFGASGRNGGFMEASLTHGFANGLERFPDEIDRLEALGRENLDAIAAAVERYGIDCDLRRDGVLEVAAEPWQLQGLADVVAELGRHGQSAELLDAEATRALINSPTFIGAIRSAEHSALVDPARLAWGLKRAAQSLGVRIYERTRATGLGETAGGVRVQTPLGAVEARRVVLGTNTYSPLVRAIRRYTVPVYDYVLMTEPLSAEQLASIGWDGREGLSDSAHQFHYSRLTEDNRILWGGYDAIYYFRNGINPSLEQRPETFEKLSQHFFETFPQLEGLSFSHAWAGVIDTCSRFCVMWGTAHHGRVSYAVGYTGLGVGATRFGARVALDLVDGAEPELTSLRFVREKPVPFPPEPARFAAIQLTRWSLNRADQNHGRRNLWLRALDRFGLGFDS